MHAPEGALQQQDQPDKMPLTFVSHQELKIALMRSVDEGSPAEGLPAVLGLPHQQLLWRHARLDVGIVLQVGFDAGLSIRHCVIPKLPQQPPLAYRLQVGQSQCCHK